jgi:hypothetical protein
VQYALAIASGLVLVPLTLHYLGARSYGLWLATGELLGYAALADLGVLGVLPWMIAEEDGRGDRVAMRRLLSNGFTVGAMVGFCYVALAVALWQVLPAALRLSASDRNLLVGPLAVLVAISGATYPLRVFSALVAGVQDVRFSGAIGVAQVSASLVITVAMLARGFGLYALAVAAAASNLIPVLACTCRSFLVTPDLLRGWPRPTWPAVRVLFANGLGGWLGAFGWQLQAASNSLVITATGHPEWVPIYSCTARLSAMATQVAWLIPDAGLIGLAQLHGERRGPERLGGVVQTMVRLHLLLGGAAACCVLAVNPSFTIHWVGAEFFGGMPLHLLLAFGIVVSSFTHGLVTSASVIGNRLRVGALTLACGAVQVPCAFALAYLLGLSGIAAAGLVTGALTLVPGAVALLGETTSLSVPALLDGNVVPWLRRVAPLLAVAALGALLSPVLELWSAAMLAAAIGATYVWWMRPFYSGLPLDPKWTRWLISLRLMPEGPAVVHAEQP